MLKLLLACKWRKLRMRIWKKRLQNQLDLLSNRLNLPLSCSLHLSWGPFYGGSAIVDHSYSNAKIMIQIPYDGHITTNEREVMSTYQIPKRKLPYFILFHEFSHLLDALPYLKSHKDQVLQTYHETMTDAVRSSTDYRKLHFEEKADRFAFEQCQNLFGQAS